MRQPTHGSRPKYAIALALAWGAVLIAGCGGSSGPDDLAGMAHDDTGFVLLYDVAAISDGEAYHGFAEKVSDEWTDKVGDIGILIDETEKMLLGVTRTGESYIVLTGEFTFEYIRDELEDNDYERDSVGGFEVWSGGRLWQASTVALMEESGMVLRGEDSVVEDILRDLSRDPGSADVPPLMRAVEMAGDGWLIDGIDQCVDELRRCERIASSVSTGGRHELIINQVFMFQDERSAEMGRDTIEKLIDESGDEMESIHSLSADGEFVTMSYSIDQKDFYESFSFSGRGPDEDPPGW